jgi:DNA-binding MarR family transcriptional regulator
MPGFPRGEGGWGKPGAGSAVRKGEATSTPEGSEAGRAKRDPIAAARANWERAGWGDVSQGMVAVTSVMRAHQILLARVETALRPYDLSFSRYELLRLLAFSRTGALPITKASDRLQVHITSVTHAIRRLEADGLVQRVPHPTDGRTTLVQITDLGHSTVEDATATLNEQVFADVGIDPGESQALVSSIETLRRNAGDF